MLQCPKCGGNVAATNHICEFCEAALLVKACPRCFARVFHGARHCGECGAEVTVPAAADPEGNATPRNCPRCVNEVLTARVVGDTLLDECPSCHGVFVDMAALDRILSDRQQLRAEAILGIARPQEAAPDVMRHKGPMYVKCPDCAAIMNRRNFARGAGIIIDVCRAHGTWFDADELPRVVQFVMQGGFASAQKRELEHAQQEARLARQRAHFAAAGSSSIGTGVTRMRSVDSVDMLGGVLSVVGDILFGSR